MMNDLDYTEFLHPEFYDLLLSDFDIHMMDEESAPIFNTMNDLCYMPAWNNTPLGFIDVTDDLYGLAYGQL